MYVNIHALNTDFAPKWPLLLPLADHIELYALVLKYSSWILTYLPIITSKNEYAFDWIGKFWTFSGQSKAILPFLEIISS